MDEKLDAVDSFEKNKKVKRRNFRTMKIRWTKSQMLLIHLKKIKKLKEEISEHK